MGNRRLAILVLVLAICSPLTAQTPAKSSLRDICSLYIGELGRESGSDIIREKIRVRLEKSGRFRIVESPSKAEAVLTGVAAIEQHTYSYQGTGGSNARGTGLFRVVDASTQQTIWSFEYRRGIKWNPLQAVSNRVADQAVDQLLNDAGERCSRTASPSAVTSYDEGSAAELKGMKTFCVVTDDPAATSALVLTLRDLLPEATFTDSPTDCRTSQATFFYNTLGQGLVLTKTGWGQVFIPRRGEARTRVLINGVLGVRLDILVTKFRDAWKTANAIPAVH